jgi:hypothetical protein
MQNLVLNSLNSLKSLETHFKPFQGVQATFKVVLHFADGGHPFTKCRLGPGRKGDIQVHGQDDPSPIYRMAMFLSPPTIIQVVIEVYAVLNGGNFNWPSTLN